MTTTDKLSCGHAPSPHSDITTGYATLHDGRQVCYDCADVLQREEMKTAKHYSAYLNGNRLTTWTGGTLAHITSRAMRRTGFHNSTRVYFEATDLDGKRWYGNSPGDGMYARLHAKKVT